MSAALRSILYYPLSIARRWLLSALGRAPGAPSGWVARGDCDDCAGQPSLRRSHSSVGRYINLVTGDNLVYGTDRLYESLL
jgi:hypothetical protein